MPGSAMRRALLLTAFLVLVVLTVWSLQRAPMRAYGAIMHQG